MATYHHIAVLQALVRDGYRCQLSGLYDWGSVRALLVVQEMAKAAQVKYTDTQCCHIFPEGTLQSVNKGGNQVHGFVLLEGLTLTIQQKDHAATAFTVLKMFGLEQLVEPLNGKGVHSLRNIITMSMELHRRFDHLELWLEPRSATVSHT